jgi:hypothetical protein
MKLYHVQSTVEAFHGLKDVIITWFMLWRAQPLLLPYEEAIRGYAELDDEAKCYVGSGLHEYFTESEAQQVLAWLNQNRRAKHEIVAAGDTPIDARSNDGALLVGILRKSIALGEPLLCSL